MGRCHAAILFVFVALTGCGGGSLQDPSPDPQLQEDHRDVDLVLPATPSSGQTHISSIDASIYALDSTETDDREMAIHDLGRISTPDAVDALLRASIDTDPHIRLEALEARLG